MTIQPGTKPRRLAPHAAAVALLALLLAAVFAPAAPAAGEMEITGFEADLSNYQAGGHADAGTEFSFATEPQGGASGAPGSCPLNTFYWPARFPDARCQFIKGGMAKDMVVDLPKGLSGDATAIPRCTGEKLSDGGRCPHVSQVGIAELCFVAKGSLFPCGLLTSFDRVAIFNMIPERGEVAKLGMRVGGVVNGTVSIRVESKDGYRLTARSRNIFTALVLHGGKLTIWGDPYSPANDPNRTCGVTGLIQGCAAEIDRVPFLAAPSECGVDANASIAVRSWLHPGDDDWVRDESAPQQVHGCEKLQFNPSISFAPTSSQADSPTGLDVELAIPQNFSNPAGLETPPLKDAKVVLPEGMTVNPASASGQGACSLEQIGIAPDGTPNGNPVACPDSSKIGSLQVTTPVLEETLSGGIYLAEQNRNPFNSLLALYLVAENRERGIRVKIPGEVSPHPHTGRLTATFLENPQLPFSKLSLHFKGGSRAPLLTPKSCGTHTISSELSAWSGQSLTVHDSFQVTSGPNGTPCPLPGAFAPRFEAGSASPIAGDYSPLVVNASRPDGSGILKGMTVKLPEGLTGKLAGVPYCPEAALASAGQRRGRAEIAIPSCLPQSRVGTADVAAGAGPTPYHVQGAVYLAGPYRGAPLSLAIVTPAVAGPFDLGTVVVRTALRVNPSSAQITALSDPIPHILQGIPLAIQRVSVRADRPQFTKNPTSCEPTRVEASLLGQGTARLLANHFQVADCGGLRFKPKLSLRMIGKTRRGGHPKLRAVLRMPKHGANIRKAQVLLPKTELLENAHIRTICTRVQYAAKACPKASIYGYAKAWTPLLDEPLQGPVYLRSSNHELPNLVADLDGQIEIDLPGRIDSVRERIRNTFWAVPDAPVSKFVLTMQGGRKSLLANNTNLCKAKPRANLRFVGQNGRVFTAKPRVGTSCKKAKRKRAGAKKRAR